MARGSPCGTEGMYPEPEVLLRTYPYERNVTMRRPGRLQQSARNENRKWHLCPRTLVRTRRDFGEYRRQSAGDRNDTRRSGGDAFLTDLNRGMFAAHGDYPRVEQHRWRHPPSDPCGAHPRLFRSASGRCSERCRSPRAAYDRQRHGNVHARGVQGGTCSAALTV